MTPGREGKQTDFTAWENLESSLNAVITGKAPPKLDARLQPCDRNPRPLSSQYSRFTRGKVKPRPAGCAAAPAGRSLPAEPAPAVPRGRTERGREGTTRTDSHSHPHSHSHSACPDTPVAQQRGPVSVPAPPAVPARSATLLRTRPPPGTGTQPGPAATGSANQPRRFREAFVPALPAGHGGRRAALCSPPRAAAPAALPARLSRTGPHQEQRHRLGLRAGGKEQRSGRRPISARLLAGGVAQWAGALLRCGAGSVWRWRRRRAGWGGGGVRAGNGNWDLPPSAGCSPTSALPALRAGTGAPQGLCVRGRETFPAVAPAAPLAFPLLPLRLRSLFCRPPGSDSRPLPAYVSPGPPPAPGERRRARPVPARCQPSGRASARGEAGGEIGARSEPGWRQEPSFGFRWVCLKRALVFVSIGEAGRRPEILVVHWEVRESEEFFWKLLPERGGGLVSLSACVRSSAFGMGGYVTVKCQLP